MTELFEGQLPVSSAANGELRLLAQLQTTYSEAVYEAANTLTNVGTHDLELSASGGAEGKHTEHQAASAQC